MRNAPILPVIVDTREHATPLESKLERIIQAKVRAHYAFHVCAMLVDVNQAKNQGWCRVFRSVKRRIQRESWI
jgi:hypothetical protein